MDIDIGLIQDLRRVTNLGISDCKQALEATSNDFDQAITYLKEQSKIKNSDLSDRDNNEGAVVSYIHLNNKVGVLLQLNCETDFISKSIEFIKLAKDIAMHIAACKPLAISFDDLDGKILNHEKFIYLTQLSNDKKPQNIKDKIVEGKLRKFCQENCLLEQKFVKDEKKTIKELLDEATAIFKEKITVKKFARFSL